MSRPGAPNQQQAAPPSFKTNVNRSKTKKWAEAKPMNYDGDDWGEDFDPYNEYGGYDGQEVPLPDSRMRQHSFDRGDERRAFSADAGSEQSLGLRQPSPGQRQGGSPQPRSASQTPPVNRQFSQPTEIPSPLYTRSVAPTLRTESPPKANALPESTQEKKPAAAIPFIRPADIYKRMEMERDRERKSTDSSRPSTDSGTRPTIITEPAQVSDVPQIPELERSKTGDLQLDLAQGFDETSSSARLQTVVDDAFARPDDSIPDTPASASGSLGVERNITRSNTDSTSDISPIMSRVPDNPVDLPPKLSNHWHDNRVSTIVEESPMTSPVKNAYRDSEILPSTSYADYQRKASPPTPRAGALAANQQEPTLHQIIVPAAPSAADDNRPPLPEKDLPVPRDVEQANPDEDLPITSTPKPTKQASRHSTPLSSPTDGRTSPFPGRVKDLAGKYNDIQDQSRRGSEHSVASRGSFSSWSRSDDAFSFKRTRTDDSLAQSPDPVQNAPPDLPDSLAPNQGRPALENQSSFRPSLPGQWVSTADIRTERASDSLEQKVHGQPGNLAFFDEPTEDKPTEIEVAPPTPPKAESINAPLSIMQNPLEALKSAGAALGASFSAPNNDSQEPTSGSGALSSDKLVDHTQRDIGDLYLKPLTFDRTAASLVSTPGPTPPAKDTPKPDLTKKPADYFDKPVPARPLNETPVDASPNTRLERDIVRSLSREPEPKGPTSTSESARQNDDALNASSALPGLLDQRFSWEETPKTTFNPSGLDREVDLPHSELRIVNTVASPFTPASLDSPSDIYGAYSAPTTESRPVATEEVPSASQRNTTSSIATSGPLASLESASSISPVSTALPPFSNESQHTVENDGGRGVTGQQPTPSSAQPSKSAQDFARIPPFRELMAIKASSDRIDAFVNTRKQFADLDTGLRDWLSATIDAHPEHSHLAAKGTDIIPGVPASGSMRNRTAPNFIKIAKARVGGGQTDGVASPPTSGEGDGQFRRTSNMASPRSPPSNANVEKMQAMGKDLLSTAGKLGGKGVVVGKGWLAKGKQKLRETSSGGGDKALPRSLSRNSHHSSTLSNSADDPQDAFTESQPPTSRSPTLNRHSRTWSTQRLSASFASFRSGVPEKSGPSSRATSINIPSRGPTPVPQITPEAIHESPPASLTQLDVATKDADKVPPAIDTSAPVSSWKARWDETDAATPTGPTANDGAFRLGILPSPGLECMTPERRASETPSTHGMAMLSPRSVGNDGFAAHRRLASVDSIGRRMGSISQLKEGSGGMENASVAEEHDDNGKISSFTFPSSTGAGEVDTAPGADERDGAEQDEKKDTPMLLSKEHFRSDTFEHQASAPPPSVVRSRAVEGGQTSEPVDTWNGSLAVRANSLHHHNLSDVSVGVVEEPTTAQMFRPSSARQYIIAPRSRPSSFAMQSPVNSPLPTPLEEVKELSNDSNLKDSPTVPEYLKARYSSLPSNMYDGHSNLSTPGEEINRIGYLDAAVHQKLQSPVEDQVRPDGVTIDSEVPPAETVETKRLSRPRMPYQFSSNRVSTASEQIMAYYSGLQKSGRSSFYNSSQSFSEDPSVGQSAPSALEQEEVTALPQHAHGDTLRALSAAQPEIEHPTWTNVEESDTQTPFRTQVMPDQQMEAMAADGPPTGDHSNASNEASFDDQVPALPRPVATRRGSFQRWKDIFGETQTSLLSDRTAKRMSRTMSMPGPALGSSEGKGKKLTKKEPRLSMQPAESTDSREFSVEKDKKKRFSALGSLFGRSKTTAAEPSKQRNRLSKQGPMIAGPPRKSSTYEIPLAPDFAHGPAVWKGPTLADDDAHPRSMTPLSRRSSTNVGLSPSRLGHPGEADPAYAPPNGSTREAQPTLPDVQPTRRLHSEMRPPHWRLSSAESRNGPAPRPPMSPTSDAGALPPTFQPQQGHGTISRGPSPAPRPSYLGQASTHGRSSSSPAAHLSRRYSGQLSPHDAQRLMSVDFGDPRRASPPKRASTGSPGWAEHGGYYIPDVAAAAAADGSREHSRGNSVERDARSFTRTSSRRFLRHVHEGQDWGYEDARAGEMDRGGSRPDFDYF